MLIIMSYALDPAWENYYKETDAAKRRECLKELMEKTEDDGANAFRSQLFSERYPETMAGQDAFLMRCRYELSLYHQKDAMFTSIGRDTRKTVSQFHLDQPELLSEAEKKALYWEFRNIALCHIKSMDKPGYGSRFFGLIKMDEEKKRAKLCEDIWSMSRGAALYAECGKKLRLYCDAFRDELLAFDPALSEQYDQLDEGLVRTLPQ